MSVAVRRVRFWSALILVCVSSMVSNRWAAAQAPAGEADNLFRNLDGNGDGRLTMDDARQNNRQMLGQVFQMAGKDANGSVTRQEFQQVFDRVRGGGQRPNQPAPNQPTPNPQTPNRPAETEQPKESEVSDSPLSGLLTKLDANDDGKLSRTEWGKLSPLFAKRDADKNASLEGDEFKGESDDFDLSQLAKRLDTNDDNKLTRTEWSRLSQIFGQMDKDRNGTLDSTELDAAQPESDVARATRGARSGSSRAADTGPSVWRGWVVNGRGENPNEGQIEMELVISGNRMVARELGTRRAPQGLGAGTFVMQGDGKTGTLDATQTEGQHSGRNYLGIFQIEGDVMRWCTNNGNGQRPREMASGGGSFLMILRRQAGS